MTDSPKIGIIGWYGHGNDGDERILYCLRQCLAGARLVVLSGLHEVASRRAELEACDFVLFGGGGLVLRRFGVYASAIADLRVRFGCVGIGVSAIHRDNRQLAQVLLAKSEFVLVRDARSWDLLGRDPKIVVGPDLTFLCPFPVAEPQASDDTCGVNLRPWPFWLLSCNSPADRAMARLNRRARWLARAYPLRRWEPEPPVRVLREFFEHLVPVAMYAEAGQQSDAEVLGQYVGEPDHREASELIGRQPYLCGMRLHSLIFACQTGTPFVSLSYQPKNAVFCSSIGMERYSVPLGDLKALRHAVQDLRASRDAVRQRLIEARDRNVAEITHIMGDIRARVMGGEA